MPPRGSPARGLPYNLATSSPRATFRGGPSAFCRGSLFQQIPDTARPYCVTVPQGVRRDEVGNPLPHPVNHHEIPGCGVGAVRAPDVSIHAPAWGATAHPQTLSAAGLGSRFARTPQVRGASNSCLDHHLRNKAILSPVDAIANLPGIPCPLGVRAGRFRAPEDPPGRRRAWPRHVPRAASSWPPGSRTAGCRSPDRSRPADRPA